MGKIKILLVILLLCAVSVNAQNTPKLSYCKADTIPIKKDTSDFSLIVYTPVNCCFDLTATRPDTNNSDILFAVPAAFTAKNYKEIVGRFVGNDTIIENPTEKETGLCTINGKNIYIGSIDDSSMYYYNALQSENTCYFQQMLLINNGKKVECTIFGKQKPTFRRALAQKNGKACVVESLNRMNIGDFTDMMIECGYTEAIYMDMGTWSEGFFISQSGEKTVIGPLKQNTRYQTNWLLFVAEKD
ncbi:MAG: hypothetical protein IJ759_05540 [Bacteroidales bacterium]|nr:hypothetical protein [Bacteroidales bacterium]